MATYHDKVKTSMTNFAAGPDIVLEKDVIHYTLRHLMPVYAWFCTVMQDHSITTTLPEL